MGLDKNVEAFVIYIISQFCLILIHLTRKTQIVLLLAKKIKILAKYLDFSNVFSEKKVLILLEKTKLNQYAIKMQHGKQPFYKPICNLRLVKLEILKTYIKINLANNFIHLFKITY